jgi:hypothetical protein
MMSSRAMKISPKKSAANGPNAQVQMREAETADENAVATRAFELWRERGCPEGSPEIDWLRAERELRDRPRAIPMRA